MHKENALIRLRERNIRNFTRERPYSQNELSNSESTTSTIAIFGKSLSKKKIFFSFIQIFLYEYL